MIDALGNGVHLDLPPGQQADCLRVPDWLAALPEKPAQVVADKADDTKPCWPLLPPTRPSK